jgi:hypothetical protein
MFDPPDQHSLGFLATIRGSTPQEIRASYTRLAASVAELRAETLDAIATVHFAHFVFLDPADCEHGRYFRRFGVFASFDHDPDCHLQDFVAHTAAFFDAVLPLVETPPDLVPVARNAAGFTAYLRAHRAASLSRLYSAQPGATALQIRSAARTAGRAVSAGSFEPVGQHMLNFVVPVKGRTPAQRIASSSQLRAVFAMLRDEPLNAIGTLHFAHFILTDRSRDPRHCDSYDTLAVLTSYDGDFRSHVRDFVYSVAPFFDRVLSLVDAEAAGLVPVRRNVDAFEEFLVERGSRCEARLYSAYPGQSALQIRRILGAPERHDRRSKP